jgi:hypothetical protein
MKTLNGMCVAMAMLGAWLIGAPSAVAEEGMPTDKGWTYAFAAPGSVRSNGTLHLGWGYETPDCQGLRAGLELGYLSATRDFSQGLGVLSANAVYHIGGPPAPRAWRPFLTAGYSLGFREGTANLFNFGGGVDYWAGSNQNALRLEFRDHVGLGDQHFWGVRVAFVHRIGG